MSFNSPLSHSAPKGSQYMAYKRLADTPTKKSMQTGFVGEYEPKTMIHKGNLRLDIKTQMKLVKHLEKQLVLQHTEYSEEVS